MVVLLRETNPVPLSAYRYVSSFDDQKNGNASLPYKIAKEAKQGDILRNCPFNKSQST